MTWRVMGSSCLLCFSSLMAWMTCHLYLLQLWCDTRSLRGRRVGSHGCWCGGLEHAAWSDGTACRSALLLAIGLSARGARMPECWLQGREQACLGHRWYTLETAKTYRMCVESGIHVKLLLKFSSAISPYPLSHTLHHSITVNTVHCSLVTRLNMRLNWNSN